MLRGDEVREILARPARGDEVKRSTRELGIDRNTVRRWRRLGTWRPCQAMEADIFHLALSLNSD